MKYLNPSHEAKGLATAGPGKAALGLMMGAAFGLSACAPMAPGLDGHADGWRRARVEAVLDAAPSAPVTDQDGRALKARLQRDCRTSFPVQSAGMRWAWVSYAYGGNPQLRHHVVAPIPEGMTPQPGQQLAVQVRRCAPLRALPTGD